MPVGLGDDADTVAMLLEHAGDDGRGKGRMVHIGIARDEDKVALVPATFFHVLLRDRKELAAGGTRRHGWHRTSVMMRFRRGFLRLVGARLALPCPLRMFRLPPLLWCRGPAFRSLLWPCHARCSFAYCQALSCRMPLAPCRKPPSVPFSHSGHAFAPWAGKEQNHGIIGSAGQDRETEHL